MLLSRLVATSLEVAGTRSRLAKVEALASLLAGFDDDEAELGVRLLTARAGPGRLGVGYRTLASIEVEAAPTATLTIVGLGTVLDEIASCSGPGSQARRSALLEGLFSAATEDEQHFIRGLIVGELRQGALEGIIAEAVARATDAPPDEVRRAVMVSGDVASVAGAALRSGAGSLGMFRLEIHNPVQPMLATTATSVAEGLEKLGGTARLEVKMDGARVQVHRTGDLITVFTRNLRDVTAQVPEVVAVAASLDADAFILDGEALAIGANGRPLPFQDTMSSFSRTVGAGAPAQALSTFFFDALHIDGTDLLSVPLARRVVFLERIAPPHVLVRAVAGADARAAESFLEEALAAGHEGVMIKAEDADYAAGRRGSAWLKVKPAYTLDLVVLAAEWGSGRRKGWLSNLHLGARDGEGGFVKLGKTFKGLTDETLAWQTRRFLDLEIERNEHVVVVRPEQVVEIAFDGVQRSTRYPGGMALRFARVKGYRHDKTAAEADTIEAVRSILEGR